MIFMSREILFKISQTSSNRFGDKFSLNELWTLVGEKPGAFVLSDEPGMGKTTEFKFMAKCAKQKFPGRWICFVDLKKYDKSYQRDGSVKLKFDDVGEILEFLCSKILKLDGFEKDVFEKLFTSGKATIFADGFDEISPSFKEFVLGLLSSIKRLSKIQLWVSTRPHLAGDLKNELHAEIYQLQALSSDQTAELVTKILETENVGGSEMSEKVVEITNFIEQLELDFNNPLLISMLTKLLSR